MNSRWIILIVVVLLIGGFLYYLTLQNKSAKPAQKQPQVTNAAALDQKGEHEVDVQEVTYFENAKGYFAKAKEDDEHGHPGVVMIHEWWGLNDNIKNMARQLASQGYNVLAVDLYNGKVAKTRDEAQQLTSSLDKQKALENMKAAKAYLQSQGSTKVASLGWCFGGGQSLQLSLNEPLDATVIYYGNLETDQATLSSIKWPVLGVFGDKDQSIPVEEVKKFDGALDTLGVTNEIYIYPGVGHAFANPSGDNYAPNETKDAWSKTVAFLKKHLQ